MRKLEFCASILFCVFATFTLWKEPPLMHNRGRSGPCRLHGRRSDGNSCAPG
jgi:hypothetical protein